MPSERRDVGDSPLAGRSAAPLARVLAGGEGWSVSELVCTAGPADRPFEERHDGYTIAAVLQGSFTYKADGGEALLYPGALLLGNHGRCFMCGHDHSAGDRCVAFNFAHDAFAEIAASAAGSSRYRFSQATATADRALTPIVVGAEAIAGDSAPLRVEEMAIRLAERVIAALSGHTASRPRISAREGRRIGDALRHIEERADEKLDLDAIARVARSSKYHFLRVFRRATGMTPYQFLTNVRMQRAAARLLASSESVASIAFGAGFGDLSTLNRRFRDVFALTPSAYRTRGPF
jgi:AraC-like DNA-binding protein